MMFGVIPGLVTARLTGFLGGVIVGPLVMLLMVRYEQYRLPGRLTWPRALLASSISFLLVFAPLLLPDVEDLLQFPALRQGFLALLPWAFLWFIATFLLSCRVIAALFRIPFRQAVSWWGIAFTVTAIFSWAAALGLTLLVRYVILPRFTDFF